MSKNKSEEKQEEEKELNEVPVTEEQKSDETASAEAVAEEKDVSQDLEKQLEDANKKIEELTDKYLRLHAEFDNYKKRSIKEKAELIKNGGERTLESFLPVADDMERALAMMEKAEDMKAIVEGIKLIQDKLLQVFTKNGVSAIDTKDAAFDTDYHEAVAMIPAESEDKKGKVVDCIQTGYKLNDKVLRHAKVVVAQ